MQFFLNEASARKRATTEGKSQSVNCGEREDGMYFTVFRFDRQTASVCVSVCVCVSVLVGWFVAECV